MQRVAILNSRQALRPTGSDSWALATLQAVNTLNTESDYTFLSSLGEASYELALSAISETDAAVEIILTHSQMKRFAESETELRGFLAKEFCLPAKRVSIVIAGDNREDTEHAPHIRDEALLKHADIVAPVSIRPGGFWERQLSTVSVTTATTIDNRFRVTYQKKHHKIKQSYVARKPDMTTARRLRGYVIHWTRATNHPWPGERRCDYYHAICAATDTYPRSALATLERILTEKRIRGSGRHMPQGEAMVGLTSATLEESIALMKYRARYREMTIEPYAVSLPLAVARQVGVRQVRYVAKDALATLTKDGQLFAHAVGGAGTDWQREKEWRMRGDLDLAPVWSELLVLTKTRSQARTITAKYGLETCSVFEDD